MSTWRPFYLQKHTFFFMRGDLLVNLVSKNLLSSLRILFKVKHGVLLGIHHEAHLC